MKQSDSLYWLSRDGIKEIHMNSKTKSKEPLRGYALAKAAYDQIRKHPKTWNQQNWQMIDGAFCFGAWCERLAGRPGLDKYAPGSVTDIMPNAIAVLGLLGVPDGAGWHRVFYASTTMRGIRAFLSNLKAYEKAKKKLLA